MSKIWDALTVMSWVNVTAVKSIRWVRSIPITLTVQPIVELAIVSHIPEMSCKTQASRMTDIRKLGVKISAML